ncbi:MAG: hypothetical protein APF84_06215 [Gracilibacter sp. BRH_c7a]|nr:MAG: hypothetical protein APF84_06215 [Gracilibacter sp. BRH_c7a]
MSIKQIVFEQLEKKEFDSLLELFDRNPNIVRRYATMATYYTDDSLRDTALEFFRFLSEKRAAIKPEYFRETIRRHIWGMNEEGGNIDWSAPEIIGIIIASEPDIFGEFASIMLTAAIAEPIFHRGMFAAVRMIGLKNKNLIEYYLPKLQTFIDDKDPELAQLAQTVLGEIGYGVIDF